MLKRMDDYTRKVRTLSEQSPELPTVEQNKKKNKNKNKEEEEIPPIVPQVGDMNLPGFYGEFHRAELTQEQYDKLLMKLNGSLHDYINRFDRWVNEAPNAKASGVRRIDRHAYESILAWHEKDQQQTHNARREKETHGEQIQRKNRELAAKLGIDYDSEVIGRPATKPKPG